MKPHNPLYYRWKGKLLHSGIHILSPVSYTHLTLPTIA